jgi:hypothetical protein
MIDEDKQLGGGPGHSDMGAGGGSSGSGGYGSAQNQQNHQGQEREPQGHDRNQTRGERFDEEQGGGRSADSISSDSIAQAGGSDGSFDQQTDGDPLGQATDEFLAKQDGRDQERADFERDAES